MADTLFPARLPGTTVVGILKTTSNISLTSAATTALYTPSGNSAVVTGIIVRITAVTAFVTAASISIGQNGSVNDIIPITALTGLNSTALFFPLTPTIVSALTISGNTISLKVTTGATATTLTASVDLLGYLV
jgi:hypothetical protein